ncbi:MAG: class B sortase [Firmicutes bacterium]|nr:class B sortase [Bacillota bacterium]
MKNILILIKNNTIIFKEKNKTNKNQNHLLNTNIISANELIFSIDYINNNKKIVSSFIKELTIETNVDTAIINNSSILSIILDVLKNNNRITSLIIKDETPLTYLNLEKLIKTNIKSLSCYNLQPFMLEILDKNNIIVESRNEILFLSNFMKDNNLNLYSSLFYKMTLRLDLPLSEQDENDFQTFCKINKYLKTIHVNKTSKDDLENIIDILRKNNKKNIKIIIHENITDLNTIEYLRNYNKKYAKKYKINYKLDYSNSYLKDNLLKQTNTSILKVCGFIILLIILITLGYVVLDNYNSMKRVEKIQEEIKKVIELTDATEIIEEMNAENKEENVTVNNDDIASLLSINPDVVGWLKVNNTNIDYPVVQSHNNEFYLNHDIYSEEDYNGWVFMDYRNDTKDLSNNIIIYAHNRYYSGVMFGTLQNALKSNWYTNIENQIISFRTLYDSYEYKIFSIYKIHKTNDYMATKFTNDEAKENFFKMLTERSIYDFNINLTDNDKIITLSTCADENNRIVVHAVLQPK